MSAFQGALWNAVVRIGAPDGGEDARQGGRASAFWGSGFFIAPGWVLTAAHVVAPGRSAVWRGERVIGVTTTDGARYKGELAFGLPAPPDPDRPSTPWGTPDLALVRVPEAESAEREPDCLWLSDRSSQSSPRVHVAGYVKVPGGCEYAVREVASSGIDSGLTTLQGTLLAGSSGGPVVDAVHGGVIGVNKGQGRGAGDAGIVAPLTRLRQVHEAGGEAALAWQHALRAHERHHLRRYLSGTDAVSWVRIQLALAPDGYMYRFSPDLRARLFVLFAQLPAPETAGEVCALVERTRAVVLRHSYDLRRHEPRSWREGVGLLYEPSSGYADPAETRNLELGAVMLYAARVWAAFTAGEGWRARGADAGVLEELRSWLREMVVQVHVPELRQLITGILEGAESGAAGGRGASAAAGPATAERACAGRAVEGQAFEGQDGEGRSGEGQGAERRGGLALTAGSPSPADGASPAGSAYADVLVEIDADLYGMHPWRVKLLGSDGRTTPVHHNENGVPREELESDIRSALALAFDRGDVGVSPAAVDFRLPRALLDEPVETWRARVKDPEGPFHPDQMPLAERRPVALRDGYRWANLNLPEWRSRWTGRTPGALSAVPLCGDVESHGGGAGPGQENGSSPPETEEAAYRRLGRAGNNDVPVYCARLGRGRAFQALDIALGMGHSVALWRRRDEQHADCEEFFDGARRLLASVSAKDGSRHRDGLPELVHRLRSGGALPDAPDAETVWARDLVLLYDPPDTVTQAEEPFREPPLQR